jgi:hypothetical protein
MEGINHHKTPVFGHTCEPDVNDFPQPRILHAVVGHKFPIYFSNAVRSVARNAPGDDILVMDNGSDSPELTRKLRAIAAEHSQIRLMFRETNDISRNAKVGGLYDAYNAIISYSLEQGYDYLHIIQNDMQLLWWDSLVVQEALQIYQRYPDCVNIYTAALPRHTALSDGLEYIEPKLINLRHYGLTDTGLYHLGRWRARDMRFRDSESAHARIYQEQGLRVLCHPIPTVAQVPWPAVVRRGRVRGREVPMHHEFLLMPLSASDIARARDSAEPLWLEDVCVPWGWICLRPFWVTDLETVDYWMYRYRDIRHRGLRSAWPRWDRRGLKEGESSMKVERRPQLWQIIAMPAWHTLRRNFITHALRQRS